MTFKERVKTIVPLNSAEEIKACVLGVGATAEKLHQKDSDWEAEKGNHLQAATKTELKRQQSYNI